jgi:hypothetical protein
MFSDQRESGQGPRRRLLDGFQGHRSELRERVRDIDAAPWNGVLTNVEMGERSLA